MNFSTVRIEPVEAGQATGVKVYVDGVAQLGVTDVTISVKVGEPNVVTITRYAGVAFETPATVQNVVICPNCREEMVQSTKPGECVVVDTTALDDTWRRKHAVHANLTQG